MIETADRLHVAPDELFRQQRQYARMMAGLARAFIAGRLVQGDVDVGAVGPGLAEDLEFQPFGFKACRRIPDRFALHPHFAGADQVAAVIAGAEALALQDAVESFLAHGAGM